MNNIIDNIIKVFNDAGRTFCDFSLNMFVQVSVLIVVLLIIDILIRKRVRATFRYCIWMLVFIKLILPPALSLPTGIGNWFGEYFVVSSENIDRRAGNINQEASISTESFGTEFSPRQVRDLQNFSRTDTPRVTEAQEVSTAPQAIVPDITSANSITWQGGIFLVWLVGVLVLSVLLIQRIFFVKGLIAQSEPAKNRLLETLQECSAQLGIKRNIQMKLSHNASSPAVCGLFNPVILIPANLLSKISHDKFKAILIHELSHIKRNDLLVNCAQTILQILYFYNPLVWLANSIVRKIREQAVDEMVLVALGAEAKSYTTTLIDVAEMAFSRPALSLRLVGVVESKKALSQRIKHILSRPIPKSAKLGFLGLFIIIITAAILLPMAKAGEKSVQDIVNEATVHMDNGEYHEAKDLLDLALERKPDFAEAWVGYGMNSIRLGDYHQAKTAYEKALTIFKERYQDSSDANNLIQQIFVLYLLNRDSDAKQLIDEGSQKYSQDYQFKMASNYSFEGFEEVRLPKKLENNEKYMATLPNGVTVELLGICEHPSEGKQWWKPDGKIWDDRPYNKFSSTTNASDKGYEIVLRFESNNEVVCKIKSESQSGSAGWDILQREDGLKPEYKTGDYYGGVLFFSEYINKASVSVGIGLDKNWKTIAVLEGNVSKSSISDKNIYLYPVVESADGEIYIDAEYTFPKEEKGTYRIVVLDKQNKTHITERGSDSIHSDSVHLRRQIEIPIKNVKEISFQTQPLQWVTFQNVSLEPEVKTDVQIETNKNTTTEVTENSENDLNINIKQPKLFTLSDDALMSLDIQSGTGRIINKRDIEGNGVEFDIYFSPGADSLYYQSSKSKGNGSLTYFDIKQYVGYSLKFTLVNVESKNETLDKAQLGVGANIGEPGRYRPSFIYLTEKNKSVVSSTSIDPCDIKEIDFIGFTTYLLTKEFTNTEGTTITLKVEAVPNTYAIKPSLSLMEAISNASSLNENALVMPSRVRIRDSNGLEYEVPLKSNFNNTEDMWENLNTDINDQKDLQQMIDSAEPESTIIIPDGTYIEPIEITKPLILKGQSRKDCILEITADNPAIFINTKSKGKVTLENMTIKWQLATSDQSKNPYAIAAKDSVVEIKNCSFEPLGNFKRSPEAVRSIGFSDLTIDTCRFEGFEYTVCFGEGSKGTIQNSLIMNSGHQGISLYEGAVVKIIGNVITGSKYHGVRSTGGTLDMKDNLIIKNDNRGVYLGNKSANGTIENNVIIGNGSGISGFSQSKVTIENNVIADDGYSGIDMRDSCKFSIRDNIIKGNERGLALFKESGKNNNEIFRNTFWQNKTETQDIDKHKDSIASDPLFNDAENGDFSLKPGTAQEAKQGLENSEIFISLWKVWKNRADKIEPVTNITSEQSH